MTTAADTKIAVHGERLNRHRGDIKRSFERIETLEDGHIQYSLDRVGDQSRFEEMSAQLQSLKETVETAVQGIEKVDKRIDERLSFIESAVNQTQQDVGIITTRINDIERERFDSVKVFKWLGTWRGTFFMTVVSAMLIGAIFPDAREWISSLFSLATRAAQ